MLKLWIKSFAFGIITVLAIIVITLTIDSILNPHEQLNSSNLSKLFTLTIVVAFGTLTKTSELMSREKTIRDVLTRQAFFFFPFIIGMLLEKYLNHLIFLVGLIMSFTFIGYEIIIHRERKKLGISNEE